VVRVTTGVALRAVAGPVVFQEGDYFGRTVNIAARIAEYARPGEVLVSQQVVDAVGGGPVSFTEVGPVELKGVSGRSGCTPPAATPERTYQRQYWPRLGRSPEAVDGRWKAARAR
jgi:class 3 adenylate cyclase